MSRFTNARVGVLLGGVSREREVSLKTGSAVIEALTSLGHTVVEIDPSHENVQQLNDAKLDVVFNALHGTYGEDGRLQGLLDWIQIPYTGEGLRASMLGFDKVLAKHQYSVAGVPVAQDLVVSAADAEAFDISELPFELPVVVKPVAEGSSVGVTIVQTPELFAQAMTDAAVSDVLVEQFVEGPELSVVILGDRVLGSVEIEPVRDFYDYEAKYGEAGTRYHVPPRLSAEDIACVEEVGLAAHRALGCRGVTRTDVILGPDGPIALETNTLPGMTNASLVPKVAASVGIDFPSLIGQILELAACAEEGGYGRQ